MCMGKILIILLLTPMTTLAKPVQSYLSYIEWKASMIFAADQKYKITQFNIQKARTANKPNNELKNLILLADKENSQITMAKDLTISDYFVGYLTKQSNIKVAIKEVSQKMIPSEISELMQAYADNFFATKPIVENSLKPATRAGFNQP